MPPAPHLVNLLAAAPHPSAGALANGALTLSWAAA